MSDVKAVVERYLATWNDPDPTTRRAAIDEFWAPAATYVDPLAAVAGADGLDAVIAGAQQQFPGLEFRLEGDVDAHHNLARFTWELGPADGDAFVVGFDVAVLDDNHQITAIHGFLDKIPT
jgi:hypothetical protein